MKIITRTVWVLSLVSLFTDMASEMLYPVMPVFLKSIGFSIVFIGILEGLAEAIAGLSKAWFGNLSDKSSRRLPFVQLGYGLSAISKPMMAVFIYPVWIFTARTLDRLGKGIRTGARDGLLNDEATATSKATVFGFHRSMDTLGAVIGPSIALAWLYFNPGDYRNLFLLAFIPGVLAIIATLIIKEKKKVNADPKPQKPTSFFVFAHFYENSPAGYKKLITGLLVFALVNSSDVFLLLQAKNAGLTDANVIGVYIFYNLVYAVAAYPLGILADKIGMKKILVLGFIVFAAVYAGFTVATAGWHFGLLFLLYGTYAAATEGVSKAWIGNLVAKHEMGTAVGTYTGFQSLAALIASAGTGILWYYFGSIFIFTATAIVALAVALYIFTQCSDAIISQEKR